MAGKVLEVLQARHQKVLKPPPPATTTTKPPEEPTITEQRAKRKIKKNQALLDLDKAESIVLDLLHVCSDTTEQFAALTDGDGDGNNNNGNGSGMNGDESSSHSSEDRVARIQKNGIEFQNKVKEIHDLLAQHAKLVVNYSNEEKAKAPSTATAKTTNNAPAPAAAVAVAAEETSIGEKKEKDHNMYASRLEMRLAIERRNLLQDLLKLEKERLGQNNTSSMAGGGDDDVTTSENATTQKRKRDD